MHQHQQTGIISFLLLAGLRPVASQPAVTFGLGSSGGAWNSPFRPSPDRAGLGQSCLDPFKTIHTSTDRKRHLPRACQPPSYGDPCLGFPSAWGKVRGSAQALFPGRISDQGGLCICSRELCDDASASRDRNYQLPLACRPPSCGVPAWSYIWPWELGGGRGTPPSGHLQIELA